MRWCGCVVICVVGGSGMGVTDEGLRALDPLTALANLDLAHCDSVSHEGLIETRAQLPALTNLNLEGWGRSLEL
jgi:hypothetical protein